MEIGENLSNVLIMFISMFLFLGIVYLATKDNRK